MEDKFVYSVNLICFWKMEHVKTAKRIAQSVLILNNVCSVWLSLFLIIRISSVIGVQRIVDNVEFPMMINKA